jgi:D-glycero-D-manno-heptose 1,7-bisphosphate phosphatase
MKAPLDGRYKVVIFDADGTLRRTTIAGQPCPHDDDEWELIDGVAERLATLPAHVALGVASNQDHVGYGLISDEAARRFLRDMLARATGRSVDPAAIQLCPHRLEVTCTCRKPEAGMLTAILAHYGVVPHEALFVGDSHVDREAAANAGTAFQWAVDFFGHGYG